MGPPGQREPLAAPPGEGGTPNRGSPQAVPLCLLPWKTGLDSRKLKHR